MKEDLMQKWEYYPAWVYKTDEIYATEKTWTGKEKKEHLKEKAWFSNLPNGKQVGLFQFLEEMGENGWEIVGTVLGLITSPASSVWPPHFLYFKRPKQ